MRREEHLAAAIAAAVLAVMGAVFTIALYSVLNGYVLSVLWSWFMVPVFKLPVLSIPYAIGLAMVGAYLTHQHRPSEPSNKKWYVDIATMFMRPLVALGLGWIVTRFV